MKKVLLMACTAMLVLGLSIQNAEAKRLGGGFSKGMQRESVTQRQASPSPATPPQQIAPHQAAPVPTPMSPAGKRSWLGPLAGLAAGLGIGALLGHLGMGEGIGGMLPLLLLVVVGVVVFKLFSRRSSGPLAANENLHYAGIGGPGMAPLPSIGEADRALPGAAPAATTAGLVRNIPADFDGEAFLRVAKVNFIRLQAANDAANLDDLREFTTPEMFAELRMDIADRHGAAQQTDVVALDAELLEVVAEAARHVASVRFHGQIREEKDGPALPFDEVWHLTKPADGSRGWAIAGIQQLN